MFDIYREERLRAWREFRDSLEVSTSPYQDVAQFWAKAPFVSDYLNPYNPTSWPDPWELVINDRYDHLAIALGICYTFQLTGRFKNKDTEIHMSIEPNKEHRFICVIDNEHVLNLHHGSVARIEDMPPNPIRIW